jgi:Fic/DOC family
MRDSGYELRSIRNWVDRNGNIGFTEGISTELWCERVRLIDHSETSLEFEKYLISHPYPRISGPLNRERLIEAYSRASSKLSEIKFSPAARLAYTERDSLNSSWALQKTRHLSIRRLVKSPDLTLHELINICSGAIGVPAIIRSGRINLYRGGSAISEAYPALSELPADLRNFTLFGRTPNASKEKVLAASCLAALKLLIIHPLKDGNGRCSRLVIAAGVTRALNLATPPYFEPIFRLRKAHIADGIVRFRKTGEIDPFLFAVSGAIRDSLKIFEGAE